jgi:hypothetical protein
LTRRCYVEVAAHHAAIGLRVERLARRGRAGDVGEEQRDGLADLAFGAAAAGVPHSRQNIAWAMN